MARIFKIIIGVIAVAAGLSGVGWGIYETILGNWHWLALSILGASITIAGFMLISGHKIREVIKTIFEAIAF